MVPWYAFFVSFFLFFGLPIIILVAGFVLFFVQSKHRKTVGVVLVVLGGFELAFWLVLTRITLTSGIVVYLATIILGFVSLYYAGSIH